MRCSGIQIENSNALNIKYKQREVNKYASKYMLFTLRLINVRTILVYSYMLHTLNEEK